jgi:NadR type nicotinamide-nucleotide adenylyltransferase
MEKTTGHIGDKIIRIALTGPECTGKSTLAVQLAQHYKTVSIPEYAREYVGSLSRPYDYDDVVHIAEMQVNQLEEYTNAANRILFLDTYLIITKVWFDLVFNQRPDWIDKELSKHSVDFYLLCDTDVPWEADPVRENGGTRREYLLGLYKKELVDFGCEFGIVQGLGNERLKNAIRLVDNYIEKLTTYV